MSSLVSGLVPATEAAQDFPRIPQAELLGRCEAELGQAGLPPPLRRNWNTAVFPQHTSPGLQQNTVRVFQWNILAQGIFQ